jgi:hypothetical protein
MDEKDSSLDSLCFDLVLDFDVHLNDFSWDYESFSESPLELSEELSELLLDSLEDESDSNELFAL